MRQCRISQLMREDLVLQEDTSQGGERLMGSRAHLPNPERFRRRGTSELGKLALLPCIELQTEV